MSSKSNLPLKFSDLIKNPTSFGLQPMEQVVEPILYFDSLESGEVVLKLAGKRLLRGKEVLLFAPSFHHDYVVSGAIAYPLPQDISEFIKSNVQIDDEHNISTAKVVSLKNKEFEGLELRFAEAFSMPSKETATSLAEGFRLSDSLNAKLFQYQLEGVAWISHNLKKNGGVILADEMGLGKTVQVIASLLYLNPNHENPALIVCPTSLIANWVSEFKKFAPTLTVTVHRGNDRAGVVNSLKTTDIVLSTYDTVVIDEMLIRAIEWNCIVCDEAQALKNPESNRRRVLSELSAKARLLMTGTPVETSLVDIWSLMDIAIPGVLGERDQFEEDYPDDEQSAAYLNNLITPLILRRTVADVAKDLPERIDIELPILLDEALIAEYESIRQEAIDEYGPAGGLVATARLSVFCAYPRFELPESESENSDDVKVLDAEAFNLRVTPKIEVTRSLINEAAAENKKILIFSNYNHISDILRTAIPSSNVNYWNAINGSTPQADRQSIIDEFSSIEGSAVLVLNPKAAGAGLNITAATVVIHYTPVWNPALESQASARAHRRGQTMPVSVYQLFYESTVEEIMIERARYRRDLGDRVVPNVGDENDEILKALTISPV
jgi:SNF2 family DNA or RNA helicase